MRLIDADKVMKLIPTEEHNARIAIAYAPTVDAVEVKHGHWEWNDYGGFGNYHCSVCKCIPYGKFSRKFHSEMFAQVLYPNYMYCPRCGAKMDEEINENETY